MKTLLFLLIPLISFGQLRKSDKPFDMYFSAPQEMNGKIAGAIIFEAVLFASSVYFSHKNNAKAYRITQYTFIASTIPLVLINFDSEKIFKKKYHKRKRY